VLLVMPLAASPSLTILMARPRMKLLERLQGYGQGYKQRRLTRLQS
jgi:hypothetical protein